MTKHTIKKSITSIAVIMVIAVMGFGIGFDVVDAATNSNANTARANSGNLQPATGQDEYRAMDDSTESSQAVHETATAGGETASGEAAAHEAGAEEEAGIVGMFGLNWKLFLAQLINFGIILFVLWKWVFGPVAKGLSQRTEKIEKSLSEATKIAEERETFETWKNGEISQVRTEAAAIITQAKRDADNLKSDTLDTTKQEQAKLISAAQAKLEQEKQVMLDSVKNDLAELVVNATQAVLKQKLDPKKDAALIEQALKEAGNTETKS